MQTENAFIFAKFFCFRNFCGKKRNTGRKFPAPGNRRGFTRAARGRQMCAQSICRSAGAAAAFSTNCGFPSFPTTISCVRAPAFARFCTAGGIQYRQNLAERGQIMAKQKTKSLLQSGRVLFVPVGSIRPNPSQPRRVFDQAALQELARRSCWRRNR